MNTLRKLLVVVFAALAVAGFSASAFAAIDPTKIFTMDVSITSGTPPRATVTIQNVTPPSVPGNSVIKSIAIKLPTGWDVASPAFATGTVAGGTGATFSACPADMIALGAELCATGFTGLKAGGNVPNTIVISFNVVPSSTPTCSSPAEWPAPLVFTGNFSQTQFAMVSTSNAQIASVYLPRCTISFSPAPPANVGDNELIVPSVGLVVKDSAGNPQAWDPSAAGLTWEITPAATVTPGTPTCAAGVCTFPNMTIDGTAGVTYALTAKTTFYGNAGPASFLMWGGTLECNDIVGSNLTTEVDVTKDWSYPQGSALPVQNGGWSLVRGPNKPLGPVACTGPVPYTFTLDTSSSKQTASFLVPSGEQQKVSAQYVIVWKPVKSSAATTEGWFNARPGLAWKTNGSGPIYMPALPCLADPPDLRSYMGTLDDLMPMIPNIAPYNQEPLLSAYGVGVKAKMCVSQHGWTAIGPADANGTDTLIQSWDKVLDLHDGYVSRDL